MNRIGRNAVRTLALVALAVALSLPSTAAAQDEDPPEAPAPLRELDFRPFLDALEALTPERRAELDTLVIEATIADLAEAMADGRTSSRELVTYYTARTRDLDVGGLQSLNELNPDALAIARTLDEERAAGTVRGPLHGVPVSIKDNIGTGDAMHTTAGAAALADARSDRDAHLVAKLRDAGAVILGKANLSEWAGFMQIPGQPPGFSAVGGQVVNPYGPESSPSGSSAGSAVGTSANLVAASVGTETLGSLIAPASANGVVGLKPSLGLVSRDRVIPITDQTDTAGVLARTVADAAAMLAVIAGPDPADPATEAATDVDPASFTAGLRADALEGVRVGFHTGAQAPPDGMSEAEFIELIGFDRAIEALESAGAEVVLLWSDVPDNMGDFTNLGIVGLAQGVATYLEQTDPGGSIASIADVVAFNQQDLERYAPFGQNALEAAADIPEVGRDEYESAAAGLRADARAYLDELRTEHQLEAIASRGNRLSSAYAVAGYPAVSVPAGLGPGGTPLGLTFVGGELEDARILAFAYAYEQASQLRTVPLGD